jgi:hypothetical protein
MVGGENKPITAFLWTYLLKNLIDGESFKDGLSVTLFFLRKCLLLQPFVDAKGISHW